MPKYHIGTNGEPAICRAKISCPLAPDTDHFTDLVEAYVEAERRYEEDYDLTASKSLQTEESPGIISHASDKDETQEFLSKISTKGMPDVNLMTYKGVSAEQQRLGIRTTEREGYLIDQGCFAPFEVTGKINRSELNEESYKEFGFKEFTDEQGNHCFSRYIRKVDNHESNFSVSDAEISNMDAQQASALNFFSSNNFEWFNGYMLRPWEMKYLPEGSENDNRFIKGEMGKDISYVTADGANNYKHMDYMYDHPESITVNNIEHTAHKLDSALQQGAKNQRIVYRGVSGASPIFRGYDSPEDYVEANLTLGTEIMFNNYQSSSMNTEVGFNYATKGATAGMMYEILTPEGVNITSVSTFRSEQEVLLPREQKYVVVGTHKAYLNPEQSSEELQVVQLVAVNDKGEILDGKNADKIEPFKYDPDKHVKPSIADL